MNGLSGSREIDKDRQYLNHIVKILRSVLDPKACRRGRVPLNDQRFGIAESYQCYTCHTIRTSGKLITHRLSV